MRTRIRKVAVVLSVALAAMAMGSAASATNDDTPYDSAASAKSSFEIPGVVSLGGEASSSADNEGASSRSTGSSFSVAGNEIASGPSCETSRVAGQNGSEEDTDSGAVQAIGDETTPATVTLFSSSCHAHAQSNNNSNASSEGAVATVSAPDAAEIVVGGSTASTESTSGESSAASSFTGASATAGDTSIAVMECSSEASDGNDIESSSSSSSLVRIGEDEQGFPEGTECPAGTSEATYSRG